MTDRTDIISTLAGELSTLNFSGEHPEIALHWAKKIWDAALCDPLYLEALAVRQECGMSPRELLEALATAETDRDQYKAVGNERCKLLATQLALLQANRDKP